MSSRQLRNRRPTGGKVLVDVIEPARGAAAVSQALGGQPKRALETRSLIRGGRRIARGMRKL